MEIKEAFYDLFTDNPVNWVKWGVVFLILILGYVVAIPLYKKVYYRVSWERKRDIARSRNHVIEATLLKKHPKGEVASYNWYATYQYFINGEKKQYKAYFKHPMTPPLKLSLYYLNSPNRLFSYDEYHWESHKGLLLFPIIFLPWILAVAALFLLKVEIPGL